MVKTHYIFTKYKGQNQLSQKAVCGLSFFEMSKHTCYETTNIFGHFCRFNCDGSALLSCAGLDALIWKVKPESDPLAEADHQEEGQEGKTEYRVSSKEGVRVEEWPGYKPQPKARKKKEKE